MSEKLRGGIPASECPRMKKGIKKLRLTSGRRAAGTGAKSRMRRKTFCIILAAVLSMIFLPCAVFAAAGRERSEETGEGINVTVQGPGALYILADDGISWEPVDLLIRYAEAAGRILTFRAESEVADGCGVFVNDAAIPVQPAGIPEEDVNTGSEALQMRAWTFTVEDPAEVQDIFVIFGEQTGTLSPVWVALGAGDGVLEVQRRDGSWELSRDAVYYREAGDTIAVRATPREESTLAAWFRNNGREEPAALYGAGYTQYIIQVEKDGNGVVVDFQEVPLLRADYEDTAGALYIFKKDSLCAVLDDGAFAGAADDLTACLVHAYDPQQKTLVRVTLDGHPLAFQAAGTENWEFFLPPGAEGILRLEFGKMTEAVPSAEPDTSPSPQPTPTPGVPDGDQILLSPDAPEGLGIVISDDGRTQVLTGLTARTLGGMTAGALKECLTAPAGAALTICKSSGGEAEEDAPVSTGMVIRAEDKDIYAQEIGIVVSGDVLGTGRLNITQLVRLAQSLNGSKPLEGLYRMAGDLNGDGNVSIVDLVAEAKLLTAQTISEG